MKHSILSSFALTTAVFFVSDAAMANADLAKAKNCMACHAVANKVVGPAYKDVAKKYVGDKTAEDKLVAKVMKGGSAAKKLHMTQPPLSQTIQNLEVILGVNLFTRSTRSISMTPAGHALIPEARRLLAQALSLPQLVQRAASGGNRSLIIGFCLYRRL